MKRKLEIIGIVLFLIVMAVVSADGAAVTLAWDKSPDPTVVGYRVKQGTVQGVYTETVQVGNSSSYRMRKLLTGVRYYFVVTSVTADGRESRPSNEVNWRKVR